MQCQSDCLKIMLLLFPAPCQFLLENCFAERLFLVVQLNFPGSPWRRLLLNCWFFLFQQVSSALSNLEQLLLYMPACLGELVNHLSLCFFREPDFLDPIEKLQKGKRSSQGTAPRLPSLISVLVCAFWKEIAGEMSQLWLWSSCLLAGA